MELVEVYIWTENSNKLRLIVNFLHYPDLSFVSCPKCFYCLSQNLPYKLKEEISCCKHEKDAGLSHVAISLSALGVLP